MTEARRDKVLIEDPLLLRRQNRPDTNVRGNQELAALFRKIPPRLLNILARSLHNFADLNLFRRRQLEHPVHPMKRTFSRQSQQIGAVDKRSRHKADRETGNYRES